MIVSQSFYPLRNILSCLVLALNWNFGYSEFSNSGQTSVAPFKTIGYESLIPTFNSSREARRSVVSGGLFSIVSFDNLPCNGDLGDVGTCYSARECQNLQGVSQGVCAGNYGVCCVVTATGGATITTNNTYFINPGYPATSTGPLNSVLTVNVLPGATELYLEFTAFQISGPTAGICKNDTFTITLKGSTMTFPVLCGNLAGQMYYIPIGGSAGPFTLTINLGIGSMGLWKIRLVQFLPGDVCAAPAGCQMYFRDAMGMVQSFNYNGGQGQFLSNICTNICFKLLPGFCSVLLTENEFMLNGMAPNDCSAGDFLLANNQKFCGDTLSNGMLLVNSTMSASFIQIQVCSGTSNPDMDLGFSLNYTLVPCAPSTG